MAAPDEQLRRRLYAEGATDEEIARAEGHSYRQIIWAWRERRGLPAHRKPGTHRRKRNGSAPPPQPEPDGRRGGGRPRHYRGLLRKGFWRDHQREIAAIMRGEVALVYTPVGTWIKMGHAEEEGA